MSHEPRAEHEMNVQSPQNRAAAKTAARLSIQLSTALLEYDAHLLELVRDAYRLAGVNVKAEIK